MLPMIPCNTISGSMYQPLGIYVHWPFCVSKCPYCDFNSHIIQTIDLQSWTTAYINELKFSYSYTQNHEVQTIFFGGGTPSLMPPKLMGSIIEHIQSLWKCANDLEISFEANPTSSEAEAFHAFKAAGANRVSIGIQAFNDKDLKFLGRPHTLDEGIKAVEDACTVFDRVSFDLIYARPNQTLEAWSRELEAALHYKPNHISLYQLTIEPGTQFHTAYARGEFTLPDENLSAELYEVTEAMLQRYHLQPYEISNYAIPGEECRHNLMYWRYNDYIGIGPGAHGRITWNGAKHATRRHRAPNIWLDHCLKQNHGQHEWITLSSYEQLTELMLMGLRLTQGVDLDRFIAITGQLPLDIFNKKWKTLVSEGMLIEQKHRVLATQKGRLKLSAILEFLLTSAHD